MSNGLFNLERPQNEPTLDYRPGSVEREVLKKQLARMKETEIEIPLIIGGKEVRTGRTGKCIVPHDKNHVLATYHKAGEKEVEAAIEAALKAKQEWENMPWGTQTVYISESLTDMISGPWRPVINAATMLNQSKTVHQSEIDAACEVIDYLKFNSYYMTETL